MKLDSTVRVNGEYSVDIYDADISTPYRAMLTMENASEDVRLTMHFKDRSAIAEFVCRIEECLERMEYEVVVNG